MIGCMLEGPVSVGAAVHVASARSNVITMLDLDGASLLATNPIKGGTRFNESNIELNDAHGLGIKQID